MAEIVKIGQINDFLTQISNTLLSVEILMDFSPNHKSCFHPSNSFLDDMAQVSPILMKQNLNSAVLHHFEPENRKPFYGGSFSRGVSFSIEI